MHLMHLMHLVSMVDQTRRGRKIQWPSDDDFFGDLA